MSAVVLSPGPRLDGRAALWTGAAMTALAAHGAALLWALHQLPGGAAGPEPAPAVLIEMAPAGAAPAEEELAAPDQAPEIKAPATPAPVTPPPLVQPDLQPETPKPPADLAKAGAPDVPLPPDLPPPPPIPDAVSLPEPTPVSRPRDLAVADAPPAPKKTRRPAPSREAARATSPDPARDVPPAPAQAGGAGGGLARWQAELMAHLERLKRYPPGARHRREEGVAQVRFSIDVSGNVLSVALQSSSGFPELDAAVLALVRRASPVPAPPPDTPLSITAPVRFNIN